MQAAADAGFIDEVVGFADREFVPWSAPSSSGTTP
jgi:hypothetical protein